MNLTAKIFHDEAAAAAHIEASRWAGEPTCPHCGSVRVRRMEGKTQAGMFLCNDCRDKFTVRTGTVMERSHVPLHKWLLAMHLLASSKKGTIAYLRPAETALDSSSAPADRPAIAFRWTCS